MNCEIEKNLEYCGCSYPSCSRKGKCCNCIKYHKEREEIPGCLFPPKIEKTYDRSIRAFIEAYKNKI